MNRSIETEEDKSNVKSDEEDELVVHSSGNKYDAINIVTPLDEFGKISPLGYSEPKTSRQ